MAILPMTRGGESLRRTLAVGGGGASNFVEDTFTDTNNTALTSHTGETGASWTSHGSYGGTAKISSNKLVPNAGVGVHYGSGVPPSADYTISFTVHLGNASDEQEGVWARLATAANTGYRLGIKGGSAGAMELYSFVAGTFNLVGSASPGWTDGTDHDIEFILAGTSLVVKGDGVTLINATDSAVSSAGRVGIWTVNGTAGTGSIDTLTAA